MSSSPLPPLYDRWISELTGEELVGEPKATCLDCAMLGSEPGLDGFDPSTKCCTHTPALPNYLVGAALADPRLDEVRGRESLRARIGRRIAVTPLGLDRPPLTTLLQDRSQGVFGKAPQLRCPHYHTETGKCGVWLHRNAVCSTWFCKHERGEVGRSFFYALRDVLIQIETELTRWCVLELGAPYQHAPPPQPGDQPHALSAADLAGEVSDAVYARRWGTWAGREEELYAACARKVGELAWPDLLGICGPEVGLRVRHLEVARQRRATSVVPAALLLRKIEVVRHGDPILLGSYSPIDPLAVPPVLAELLPAFKGQPTAEARAQIAEDTGLELDDDLLVRLVDFGLLVDAAES